MFLFEGYYLSDSGWDTQAALGPLPLGAASIWAGRALLTHFSKGSRLRALALPADAVPAIAADLPIFGPACADVCGAVAVVADISRVAFALSAVTFAMACQGHRWSVRACLPPHRNMKPPDACCGPGTGDHRGNTSLTAFRAWLESPWGPLAGVGSELRLPGGPELGPQAHHGTRTENSFFLPRLSGPWLKDGPLLTPRAH